MDISPFLVQANVSILAATAAIDANRKGAVIVVLGGGHLYGLVTDGDVRRAILAGLDLREPVSVLLERRHKSLYPAPISANEKDSESARLALMREHKIRHLPIVNDQNVVVDLVLLDNLLAQPTPPIKALVMAGGSGQRLRPLTNELPKPMLPVHGKPLLERLIEQLRSAGIHHVKVTTHYKPEHILKHFGGGEDFGVQIEYVQESEPLGTAGALGLLEPLNEPLLIINGDILTRVDFAALRSFHQEHQAEMTVAVREYTFQVPYGVITVQDVDAIAIEEKPSMTWFVNAGIYLLSPTALEFAPRNGTRMDMPDLINTLIRNARRVVSFPIREYWLDIGQLDDYERAQKDVAHGRFE